MGAVGKTPERLSAVGVTLFRDRGLHASHFPITATGLRFICASAFMVVDFANKVTQNVQYTTEHIYKPCFSCDLIYQKLPRSRYQS